MGNKKCKSQRNPTRKRREKRNPETQNPQEQEEDENKGDEEEEEEKGRAGKRFYACYLLTSLSPRSKGHTYIGLNGHGSIQQDHWLSGRQLLLSSPSQGLTTRLTLHTQCLTSHLGTVKLRLDKI